jgi:hypothetical protein
MRCLSGAIVCCLVAAALVCASDAGATIAVKTGLYGAISHVDARYLSFNVDWWDPVHMANYQRPDYPDGCPRFESIADKG